MATPIWNLNDATHGIAINSIKDILKSKITAYDDAVSARNVAKGNSATKSYRNLLSLPLSENSEGMVYSAQLMLNDILTQYDVPSGQEQYYAHIAKMLSETAKHFTELANLWAETISVPNQRQSGETLLSDEQIQAMAKECDDTFKLLLDNVVELNKHRNDPQAQSMLEHAIGQSLTTKSSSDGTVKYQLDIDRIRITQNKNQTVSERLSLEVDGIAMNLESFRAETTTAFNLSGSAFLDLFKEQNPSFTYGTPYRFEHNSRTYRVIVKKA